MLPIKGNGIFQYTEVSENICDENMRQLSGSRRLISDKLTRCTE
jgi:hypothetical protein